MLVDLASIVGCGV